MASVVERCGWGVDQVSGQLQGGSWLRDAEWLTTEGVQLVACVGRLIKA